MKQGKHKPRLSRKRLGKTDSDNPEKGTNR